MKTLLILLCITTLFSNCTVYRVKITHNNYNEIYIHQLDTLKLK